MLINARNFLTYTRGYLRNQTKIIGYDTCHRIQNYNARKCDRDCKKLEKSDFAKNCRNKNGLFKCCIRLLLSYFFIIWLTQESRLNQEIWHHGTLVQLIFKLPVLSLTCPLHVPYATLTHPLHVPYPYSLRRPHKGMVTDSIFEFSPPTTTTTKLF